MIIEDKALNPYYIEQDNTSYIVKKKGKKTDTVEGYYTTMKACINKVVELKMANIDDKHTLLEFLSRYMEIKHEILNAVTV